jgi:hypothetical protein
MSKQTKKIDNTTLKIDKPTNLTLDDLYTWTIWQFPHKVRGGLCGAVHPPIANYGWLPAVIRVKDKKVQVHAHLDQTFDTPETAAKHVE